MVPSNAAIRERISLIRSHLLSRLNNGCVKEELIKLSVESFPTPIKYHVLDYEYLTSFVTELDSQFHEELGFLYLPYGKVLLGLPSNEPLVTNTVPIIVSLAAGNYVLVKPSSKTIRFVTEFIKLLPEDISKNIALLDPAEAKANIDKYIREADFIYWMASSKTYKHLYNICAKYTKQCNFEAEGNDMVVLWKVHEDYLDKIIEQILHSLVYHEGKRCQTPRILLTEDINVDKVFEKLNAEIQKLKKGDIWDPTTDISTDTEVELLKIDSEDKLLDVIEKLYFGPRLSIYGVSNILDLIRILNSNRYRISLYMFTNDDTLIDLIINNLRPLGRIVINSDIVHVDPSDPWGGYGLSGGGVDYWVNKFLVKVYLKGLGRR